ELRAEEWLLIEWPEDETEPTKYWFSTLPEDTAFDRLVDLTKLRWRIERDYQELKQELGLGDYEGRGWRGFHHHATLCIAAYGFLIAERGALPPSGPPFAAPLPRFELSVRTTKIRQIFNLAVPANEFVNLAELMTQGDIEDYRDILRDGPRR